MFNAIFVAVALAPTMVLTPMATAVANWFKEKIGIASGLYEMGFAACGLIPPILVWLMLQHGWRMTFVISGLGMWAICIPLAFVIRHEPEQYGLLPDGVTPEEKSNEKPITLENEVSPEEKNYTFREAVRSLPFWLLVIGYGFGSFAYSTIMLHLMPYLISIGNTAEVAALGMTFMSVSSTSGRLAFGWLSDKFKKRYIFAICYATQLVGLLILTDVSALWAVFLALAIWAPGYGGMHVCRIAIMREYFGRKNWGVITGALLAAAQIPGIIGPIFAGWMFDLTNSYRLAFLINLPFYLTASVAVLMSKPPSSRKSEKSP